jgi:hypothetical protein
MLRQTAATCCALLVAGTLVQAQAPAAGAKPQAGPDPWLVRTTKVQFLTQRAPDAPVQIDLPKKDWMVLPSSGTVLLTAASKKGDAVVVVDRSALRQALEPSDITDLFAQIEIDAIKERDPKATDFQSKTIDSGDRRLVAIQYTRPGVLGSERVRQYSMPMGRQLYRVTCISAAGEFGKLDQVFSHMAASFSVAE